MTTLYVTESSSFIKRKSGHVIVGRNHEVLFEVPFESIDDVTVFDVSTNFEELMAMKGSLVFNYEKVYSSDYL